ncbi:alpha/beta hydrolase fold domain-containing protein [Amnibacterium setariae]|uniref:Steryl acetyl hydrolase n=1 Tax=Amnibacterium setariae TaxID=2306585 RepID=A0A3A1U2C1_9MICO|nr:alpha/beta hydrolase fold domain-containing protein [Amnibacterium setariae]RIX28616.1 steryl acetyl hydrolase [Amnibacterium setariae]
MTRAQSEALSRMLREGPLDLGGEPAVQRPLLDGLLTAHPLPDDVRTSDGVLSGVPVVEVEHADGAHGTVLFFHGGAYAIGSARGAAGMLAEIVTRTGVRGISVEYRLAPEHPYPAAVHDALAAYRGLLDQGVAPGSIVVAGESAGGGLALALLLAARAAGLPQPAAAFVFSPWADLTLSGSTLGSKAEQDPALSSAALRTRAADYLAGSDPADPLVSPALADLTGLPPLLLQCGSAEILLADALRLAVRAAEADIAVELAVTPHAPHVFQGFPAVVDEAVVALDDAAAFVSRHLHGAARP